MPVETMIKLIFAYILAFFLGPFIGGTVGLVTLPLFLLISKVNPYFIFMLSRIVIGLVSVWVAAIVFLLFGFQLTLLMVILLGFGFIRNDFNRISHAPEAVLQHEVVGVIGDLLGIVIGGIYFL
jgi:hypothetical protein